MRIALFGDFMFNLASGLRMYSDHEISLFLDAQTVPHCLIDEPLLADKSLVNIENSISISDLLNPQLSRLSKCLSNYDLAIVSGIGAVFAQAAGIDYFFVPNGSDLTQWPFPIRTRSIRPRGKPDLLAAIVAARMRPAIRSATRIWASPFRQNRLAVERLGCSLDGWHPAAVNCDVFEPGQALSRSVSAPDTLRVFHPTRIMLSNATVWRDTGGMKRQEVLIKGFALAVGSGINSRLVLIERGMSEDELLLKALISTLGLDQYVEWIRPPSSNGFSWRQMVSLYQSADIVVDDFQGWFGLIAIEAAACGKLVINDLEQSIMEFLYPDGYPFVQASNENEVSTILIEMFEKLSSMTISYESREWALKNHSIESVTANYLSRLSESGVY